MQTRVKTFHASSTGRRDLSEENGYVYCSRTKPAIVAEKSGRTMAFYLAPFSTNESRETIRQNANFHALYFSICHGMEAGQAAVRNLPGVAQELGYRVALPQSQSVALSRVEDILPPESRRSAEARNDTRPMPPANMPPAAARRDWAFDEPADEFGAYREAMPPRQQPVQGRHRRLHPHATVAQLYAEFRVPPPRPKPPDRSRRLPCERCLARRSA